MVRTLDFETKMRDDLRTQYSSIDDSSIVDDTILSQLVVADTEDSFKTGELQGILRIFDDAWILAWSDVHSNKSGIIIIIIIIIISIQRDSEQTSMADIEWCIEYLDEEVAPLIG
jgi:hypothetical protein